MPLIKEEQNVQASPLAYVVDRLRSPDIVTEPFPHYYLENVFPDDYYRDLINHLPGSGVYQNLFEVTDYKLDHFRYREQRDLKEGWTESLPDGLRGFWDRFNEWFLGHELATAVLRSFAGPMRDQFGDEQSWPTVSVEPQLIRHRAGYFLGPHSDLYTKIVVLLIYLARDERAGHLGTSLYRPKDPTFTCNNSIHHAFDDFIRVKTVPYKPNSMLAFMRSGISFHGVEPLSDQDVELTSGRDLIQYVLHDKLAREEQLRRRAINERAGTA